MLGELDKQLMYSFLERNYPVARIKVNKRFKRGIILDDGSEYHLSNPSHVNNLWYKLSDIIKIIFNCQDDISVPVIKRFLNI